MSAAERQPMKGPKSFKSSECSRILNRARNAAVNSSLPGHRCTNGPGLCASAPSDLQMTKRCPGEGAVARKMWRRVLTTIEPKWIGI